MNLVKSVTKVYPEKKGLKFIELLSSKSNNVAIDYITNKGQYIRSLPEDSTIDDSLTNSELNVLYVILFNEKPSDISQVKSKLKLGANGNLIDFHARKRYEEIKNDIDQTIKLYRSTIMPTIDIFQRFIIQSIDNDRIEALTKYLSIFLDIKEDDVKERYRETSKNRDMYYTIDKTVDRATQVIQKVRYIIKDEDSNCDTWIITFTLDGIPYATSVVSYNENKRNDDDEKYIVIEGNSLYPIPTLAKILFPEYIENMPQFDDLMYASIDDIAKELDVKVIYTSNREEIDDITNYGFTSTDYKWEKTCNLSSNPSKHKYVKRLNDKDEEKDTKDTSSIKYRLVTVYSVVKARQFLKYQVGYGKLKDDLTDEQLLNLYRDLYSVKPENIQVARDKLEIDDNGKLLDPDARNRLDSIFKRTENTTTEIGLIDASELPFRRFSIEGENEDNVKSITKYLSKFTQISENQVLKAYTSVDPRMTALINYEVEMSKGTLTSNRYMLENEDSNCIIIRFTAYHYNTPYASALVTYRREFRNDKNEEYIVIEDMTKYPIPILAEMLFPMFLMPNINEILLPKIEEITKKLNVNLIYTQELDKNRDKERYGFVKTDYKWPETCNTTSTAFGTRYMKYMNQKDPILSYTTVNIYPISKANEFLKYRGSQGSVKNVLSGEESIELYRILYDESKVNKEKLKINRGEFQDEETRLRFDNIMNRIGDTEREIMSINKYETPFRRIGFRDANVDKVEALARYLSVPFEEVVDRYKKADANTRSLIESHIKGASHLLHSDKIIIEAEDSDCTIMRVTVYYRNAPYASALVTYRRGLSNDENVEYVVIENMTKYPIPLLAEMLFPEYPILDVIETLLPKIEEVARELGVNVIYLDVPEEINNTYGFVATDYQWEKTCNRTVVDIGFKYMKKIGNVIAKDKYYILVTLTPIVSPVKNPQNRNT